MRNVAIRFSLYMSQKMVIIGRVDGPADVMIQH
jgi:hypothetical protein